MDAVIQPVTQWWRAFSGMLFDFWRTMGPAQYGYLLIGVGIIGYFFLKGGITK